MLNLSKYVYMSGSQGVGKLPPGGNIRFFGG